MRGHRWSLVALMLLLAVAAPFKVKVAEITRRGGVTAAAAARDRTTVTESEVNSYLAVEVADDLPSGVVSPTVTLLGQGRTKGQAVVDLDRVRQGIGATS